MPLPARTKYRATLRPGADLHPEYRVTHAGREVAFESFALRTSVEPGRPLAEWWADVTINGVQYRLPVRMLCAKRKRKEANGHHQQEADRTE